MTHRSLTHRFTAALLAGALSLGCSSSDDDAANTAGGGGSGGTGTGGSGAEVSARAGSTASGGTGADAGGGTGNGGTSGAGMGNSGTSGTGGGDVSSVGVCGQRGESTVSKTEFDGWEEFYLLGEEGFGDEVCVVRVDVARVGDAAGGCTDCAWSHLVEFSNPTVVVDTGGACAKSDLGFDDARLDAIDGSRAGYGYVFEFMGHNDVLLKNEPGSAKWDAFGNAVWNETTHEFHFDRRDGFCNY